MALLEAMATGLRTVVSDVPGNRGMVDDHVSRLISKMSDHGALALAPEGATWSSLRSRFPQEAASLIGAVNR